MCLDRFELALGTIPRIMKMDRVPIALATDGVGKMEQMTEPITPQIKDIGARLRHFRKERGMTQSELADQVGIQQSDLSRMEKGEYRVSLNNLFRLLKVFGVQLAEFFDEHHTPQTPGPLSQEDMILLQIVRQLSAQSRIEVREFAEFKRRRERVEQYLAEYNKRQRESEE
jgi:transcriptional regulator with XRE-family HTH domain